MQRLHRLSENLHVQQREKTLGSTTCRIFVNRLAAALNMAVREGLIDNNPFKLLDAKEKPQKKSAMREFLTIEELRTLIATPCRYEIVKRHFCFLVSRDCGTVT